MQLQDDLLYTVKEAQSILKVSKRTVQRWIKDNRIESVKLGRLVRIPGTALAEIVRYGIQESTMADSILEASSSANSRPLRKGQVKLWE